ncbi:MAG: DUF4143 domain-containing protein, partial [Candidatus Poribacteria bacterium]
WRIRETSTIALIFKPNKFLEMIPKSFGNKDWIIIDEVQRIPELLNSVHMLIEEKKIKFALTGSSARKLKRGGANLLAGRAFLNSIHPLTSRELGSDFQLDDVLNFGSLPHLFSFKDIESKKEYLRTYVATYLREEIMEEQIIRRLDPFVRFLESAAQCNGQIINAAKIGRDALSDKKAVLRYFQVLTDTLTGFFIEPYHTSVRKVQTAKSKFYFFDPGITRSLQGALDSSLVPRSYAYGRAFEHFFILECLKLKDYLRKEDRFYYSRTKDGVEIDLLIERSRKELIALEIKSSTQVDESELRPALSLAEDLKVKRFIVACREDRPRKAGVIEILPWRQVLEQLYPA